MSLMTECYSTLVHDLSGNATAAERALAVRAQAELQDYRAIHAAEVAADVASLGPVAPLVEQVPQTVIPQPRAEMGQTIIDGVVAVESRP